MKPPLLNKYIQNINFQLRFYFNFSQTDKIFGSILEMVSTFFGKVIPHNIFEYASFRFKTHMESYYKRLKKTKNWFQGRIFVNDQFWVLC